MPPDDAKTPGQVIASLREQAGLTRNALARLAGVDRAHLVKIESGLGEPGLGTARRIFAALGVGGREAWAAMLDG